MVTIDDEPLDAELARLDALVHAELLRMRARYELSVDEFHGLYITDRRVDALLAARPQAPDVPAPPDVAAVRAADRGSRWSTLAASLGLSDDERDLLLVCLAPELDARYETLYAHLNDDVTRRWPTTDLAVRLLGRTREHQTRLRGLLLPGATLASTGAIEPLPGQRDLARARRALRAAPPLADWLRGLAYADERITAVARFGAFERLLPDEGIPAHARGALEAVSRALAARADVPPVVLTAPTAAEAACIAEEVIARAGRLAIVLDLVALKGLPAPAESVAAVELAQRVLGVAVVLSPLEALFDLDGRVIETVAPLVRRMLTRSPAVLLAAAAGARANDALGDSYALHVRVPDLTVAERTAVWRAAIAANPGHAPADHEAATLADRFLLGADRILRASLNARHEAALHGSDTPSPAQMFAAAQAASFDGSGGVTRAVSTAFDWSDLVLPAAVKERLGDVVRAIELRARVLDGWGFARRVGNARGIAVMFAGPSGTGKTMAAAIMAKTLHLQLERIELGTVVSKYIGETEKNLDRAFAAARRANAILFIDEADALLGKRSQVKDAHDRYANVEIAYLLQKMEDHDGVVIVATNLAQNVDDAFSRRMQFVIEFPLPDATSRELLWRSMLPEAAPIAADVDLSFLARQFELAGGDIRNVVLDAAYRAAHDETAITLGHLLRAVARQYAKRGRVPTAADFREHFGLLREAHA